jgi:hypothetical protein
MFDILFDIFELSHATAPALPSPAVAKQRKPKIGGRNPSRAGRTAKIRSPRSIMGKREKKKQYDKQFGFEGSCRQQAANGIRGPSHVARNVHVVCLRGRTVSLAD